MPRYLALLLVGLVAFAAGTWLSMRLPERVELPERLSAGYILDEPRPLPPFRLTDNQGHEFSPAGFEGDWSFLFFGYTYCPDICPMSLSELAQVKKRMDGQDPEVSDRYYLVSVDPDRDTAERLDEYVHYFDPEFRGLTGPEIDIDQFTRSVGVVYELPAERTGDYLVGHSGSITLINPEGRIHAIFTTPHVASNIADDFEVILERYQPGGD
jgi:protein SCO1/2